MHTRFVGIILNSPPKVKGHPEVNLQGSSGVNQRSNCLGMPNGHQIWSGVSLQECNPMLGSKVMQGSSGVNQR